MQVTMFLAMSLDGFVARPDDGLDFLPSHADGAVDTFTPFMATVDAMVMGRRTFDVVLGMGADPWPYGETPIVVWSRSMASPPPGAPASVTCSSAGLAGILADLAARGARHVYVDGALTAQEALRAGLVTDLVITVVPVLIGAGVPLWGALAADVPLELVGHEAIGAGMVQLRYRAVRVRDPA